MVGEGVSGRVIIPAAQVEFIDGGNTLWVHGPGGGTILRIKVSGVIRRKACTTSPTPHADAFIHGDVEMCMPSLRKMRKRKVS